MRITQSMPHAIQSIRFGEFSSAQENELEAELIKQLPIALDAVAANNALDTLIRVSEDLDDRWKDSDQPAPVKESIVKQLKEQLNQWIQKLSGNPVGTLFLSALKNDMDRNTNDDSQLISISGLQTVVEQSLQNQAKNVQTLIFNDIEGKKNALGDAANLSPETLAEYFKAKGIKDKFDKLLERVEEWLDRDESDSLFNSSIQPPSIGQTESDLIEIIENAGKSQAGTVLLAHFLDNFERSNYVPSDTVFNALKEASRKTNALAAAYVLKESWR